MRAARVPVSTYRVQLSRDFRFLDARDLIPYLHALGVGDLYCSPRFRARRGSSHGYDVADPALVNSELGTETDFDALCERLKQYEMGLLLDIVPNHMVASHENPWWMDVLEHGPSSPYAHYFDIDWHPVASKAAFLQENKVILPILGDLYGATLENQELSLRLDEEGCFVEYYDRKLPLDPATYPPILERFGEQLLKSLGDSDPAVGGIAELRDSAASIPARTVLDSQALVQRREVAADLKKRLFHLYRDRLEVRLTIDAALREMSGVKGDPGSFDFLHALLSDQAYRLASWKIAYEEMNYRRFFDINDLVCLRVEAPDVFDRRHAAIVQLVREGKVTGLRVDHIDGLHDPSGYLERLQSALGVADSDFYVVVEEVLGKDEPLPADWQVRGTTGYDFLNAVNDIFIHPDGLEMLEAVYDGFTGQHLPFAEICYARNKQVMWKLFAGEVRTLGHALGKLAAQDRHARDVPLTELMRALVEVTACLPVYRTYIRGLPISETDRRYLERTLDLARQRTTELEAGSHAFAFFRSVLLPEPPSYARDQLEEYLRFVMRWQQFTGPVMAKGLEDTAFYVHNSVISRNEVGADPLRETPPLDLAGSHRFNERRLAQWPHSMSATSTHDTKRGEDVRARVNVLSELPAEWEERLLRWSRWNKGKKTVVDGQAVPTPGEEVLIYQNLLGAWPLRPEEQEGFRERFRDFVIKAAREAKIYTGWIRHHAGHEDALARFAEAILDQSDRFWPDFMRFYRKIAFHGALNGLSQVLLKITAPGVPDFYQGSELWHLWLVDPDNRRPVDFRRRVVMLEELRKRADKGLPKHLLDLCHNWKDGRIKLYLTDKALDFRRERSSLFLDGGYVPVAASGENADCVCAFVRCREGQWSVTVTPRWTTRLTSADNKSLNHMSWGDTMLSLPEAAPRRWRDILTTELYETTELTDGVRRLPLDVILRLFPVALLEGVNEE